MNRPFNPLIVIFTIVALAIVGLFVGHAQQPQPKMVLPIHIDAVHDGDTLTATIQITTSVRLLDCWAPELKDAGGWISREQLAKLTNGKHGMLEIPLQDARRLGDVLTFGRVLGRVWVDGKDVGEQMVAGGHASKTKK